MTVLITGGAGYVGSHVVLALLRRGEKVIVVDDLSTGDKRLVHKDAEFQEIDMTTPGVIFHLCSSRGITDVIHMAAKTSVPDSIALPMHYLDHNYNNSLIVVENALDAGVKNFVFSSTAAVYGDQPKVATNGVFNGVHESTVCNPQNAYGRSKLMAEWMLEAQSKRFEDMRYVALRYFNVAGADPKLEAGQITGGSLFRSACQAALNDQYMPVYGDHYLTRDGTAIRDYVHVMDIADAHLKALDLMRKTEHFKRLTLNVGYGSGYTVKEVVDAVGRAHGKPMRTVSQPPRAGDVAEMVADSSRIQKILGWRPHYNLLETMAASALEWEVKWRRMNEQS